MSLGLSAQSLYELDAFRVAINHAQVASAHHVPLTVQLDQLKSTASLEHLSI